MLCGNIVQFDGPWSPLMLIASVKGSVLGAEKILEQGDAMGPVMSLVGVVGAVLVCAFCRQPHVKFFSPVTVFNRKQKLTPIGAKLYAVFLLLVVLGVVSQLALRATGQGNDQSDDQATGQASSTGPSFSLAALFDGAAKLDCASPDVKKIITDNYAEQFTGTGVPDLAMAVERKRINFRVEMITETGRNTASHFVNCKGNLIITFPGEDLAKARKALGDGGLNGILAGAIRNIGPVFTAELAYKVSIPADKEERKNGPVVEFRFVNSQGASDKIGVYGSAYGALAYTVADVSASKRNDVKWDKAYKDAVVQECGKQSDLGLCQCRLDQFEKVWNQEDFQRIGYIVQTKTLDPSRYPNFIALSDSLSKQCPLPQGIASVLAPAGKAAPSQVEEPAKPVEQTEASPSPAMQQAEATQPTIAASFDCTKAASKIEKLICSTPEAADADRRLTAAYSAAKSKSADPSAVKADQVAWIKQQRNACGDAACLLKTTEARIQALSAM